MYGIYKQNVMICTSVQTGHLPYKCIYEKNLHTLYIYINKYTQDFPQQFNIFMQEQERKEKLSVPQAEGRGGRLLVDKGRKGGV